MNVRRLFALLLAASCHSNVTIDLAPLEGRSALLWIYVDGELVHLWGTNLEEGKLAPPPPGIAYEKEVELLAMTFACPLADTGLGSGAQKLLDFPEYDLPRTPPPRRLLATKIEAGEQNEWKELSEPDPRMADSLLLLDLPEDNVCSKYTVSYRRIAETRIPSLPESQVVFAQVIDERRILIGTGVGQLYEIDDRGNHREITSLGLAEEPIELEFRASFRDDDGLLWLYTADGRMARGTIDGGFEMVPAISTATGADVALAGSPQGAPFELFAVTSSRKLARFDGSAWSTVYEGVEAPICRIGLTGRLVMPATATWVAPGEALVHGAGEPTGTVLRYREGQAFEEPFPESTGSPASVLQTDLGSFAGTCEGDLVRRDEQSWVPAFSRRAATSLPIVTLVRSGGGFLYPGARSREGVLTSYHPSIGYCTVEELEGFGRFILRAGRTVFLVYLRFQGSPIQVILYEEGEPPCFSLTGGVIE
jgi:hypothetical protein